MGVFSRTLRLTSMNGGRSLEVEAMVDTGAAFSIVPAGLLQELGVSPIDRLDFTLADGRRVACDIGEALATVEGKSITTLVAFGEEDTLVLLGAYTLEGLRFGVDPVRGELVPLVARA